MKILFNHHHAVENEGRVSTGVNEPRGRIWRKRGGGLGEKWDYSRLPDLY